MGASAAGSEPSRVSEESLREASGRGWEGWFEVLDAAGALDLSHRDMVRHLDEHHRDELSAWWQQTVVVGYEKARGLRVVGQTAGAGFQIGVQRTLAAPLDAVWETVVSRPDLWLGEGASVQLEPGRRYDVPAAAGQPAAAGEVRVVRPGNRLRITWQPEGWAAPATIQIAVQEPAPGRTALHAHMEKLPDGEAREAMRARWRGALARIAAEVE